jgi:hypothetical protein
LKDNLALWMMPACASSPQPTKEDPMAKKHTFHCWMRVVATGEIKMKIPTKPPKKTSQSKPADVAEVWTGYDGLWNEPVTAPSGGSPWVLDLGEVFYEKKSDAIHWIEKTQAGQDWKKVALCCSLVVFEIEVDK